MMVLVCSLAMFGMQNIFNLCLQHILKVDNAIADALSRFDDDQFWHLAPDATGLLCVSVVISTGQAATPWHDQWPKTFPFSLKYWPSHWVSHHHICYGHY